MYARKAVYMAIYRKFRFLTLLMDNRSDDELIKQANRLAEIYKEDLEPTFSTEVLQFSHNDLAFARTQYTKTHKVSPSWEGMSWLLSFLLVEGPSICPVLVVPYCVLVYCVLAKGKLC